MDWKKIESKWLLLAGGVLLVGLVLFFLGKPSGDMTPEEAASRLSKLLTEVQWTTEPVRRRAHVQLGQSSELKDTLPEIEQFELVVNPFVARGEVAVEIFVSTEKSGTGTDGWIVESAKAFNARNFRLGGGQKARVQIRKIASGTGYQFIASGKYLPDAYSPSNHLWIAMARSHNLALQPVRERLVGNLAGIVMKVSAADKLGWSGSQVDLNVFIEAVVQGKIAMGYTNPFASSTGLNFLVTVLAHFAGGNESAMLSPEVVSAFEQFQRGVPFVAMTTLQMRDSVQNDGSLDAFVMEHQTFVNAPSLQSGYRFMPFGVRHDNPLYAVGDLSAEKLEVLEKFAAFLEQPERQKKASEYGFNSAIDHTPSFQMPSGGTLIQAQKLWKEKKDADRPIVAVFLCDVSGSMGGARINRLKNSLMGGSVFINPRNSIGLVLFSSKVTVVLPIAKFNLTQKAAFHAAVEDIRAGGRTAMYDGIAVALSLLLKEKENNPQAKPMLFVLTDGETGQGLSFKTIRPVIEGIRIPIYTIGYDANLPVLREVSSIVEAASINADQGDVEYKIGSLLNAQM